MATYTTLEEIKASIQTDLFGDDRIELRPEQRDAIDFAKEKFCKKSGRKPDYEYSVLPEYRQFLWNAKMRFGKTICALQLAREMDVKRTLIITHRPVVGDSWFKAFRQVFGTDIKGNSNVRNKYGFGARSDMEEVGNFYDLEQFVEIEGNHYVFFVSMQYIRLSELVNAKTQAKNLDKQDEDFWGHSSTKENEKLKADILNTDWDLVVIDEAHEGTRTALGKRVIDEFLKKEKTKMLHLSGTPFNLYEDFNEDEIYTWDYISEQQAKLRWGQEHPGERNPYEDLPKLNIFTYDITKNINQILDQTGVFTFTEFFRTWTGNPKADRAVMPDGARGRFVHEEDVKRFLNLLCTKDASNNFPFSTDEYRGMFRHTLWVVSHVDEAKALSQLLHEHSIFKRFKIINVAGNGDSDEQRENALDAVKNAIGDLPEKTSTITISCGRLTTGVTVAPWSAVFYLKGGDRAATYMQTIFRVQSPYKTSDGKMKTSCYVFDFAPDRTLKIVAETAKFSSMAKAKEAKENEGEEEKTQEMRDKDTVKDFIELCPVISMEGGQMSPLDVKDIYKQLENVFIDRLVRKGFDDPCLYNQDELIKVNPEILNHIGENGGQAPDEKRKEAKEIVDLSHMTPEQRAAWEAKIANKKAEAAEKAAKKAQKDEEFKAKWESMTDEERDKWLQEEAEKADRREEEKKKREEFKKRITNIRGISLRIPLLMYGGADAGECDDEITVHNFTRKIKDESWEEFMPKGITKEDFNKIKKCFNETRFFEAGKKYREIVREADFMHVEERIKQITEIFSYFRNPDKETVLTPWRVVNMHMSDTLGGWCFYDETFDEKTGFLERPRYVNNGNVTKLLFDNVDSSGEVKTKILEINSKTGLYPLYVTYSLYRRRLEEYVKAECIDPSSVSVQEEQVVWDDIVKDNIFVICNTPMAVGITRRTLFGFRGGIEKKANIKTEKLIEKATSDKDYLTNVLKSEGFWKGTRSKDMIEFNAIVGNPPYQLNDGSGAAQDSAIPLYHEFVNTAKRLNPLYISMIMPSKWMVGGRGLAAFRKEMVEDKKISKLYDFEDSSYCFPTQHIDGGISYLLWDKNYHGQVDYTFRTNDNVVNHSIQDLKNPYFDYVIRDCRIHSILDKCSKGESISSIISNVRPFGVRGYLFNNPERYPDSNLQDRPFPGSIKAYGVKGIKGGAKRTIGYISPSIVTDNIQAIDMYKLYFTTSYSTNAINPPEVIIGEPGSMCTETFLLVGPFKTEKEQVSCYSYMQTKLFKFLLYYGKGTMHVTKSVFALIPLQTFDHLFTDVELFKKYNLDKDEIKFIENLLETKD